MKSSLTLEFLPYTEIENLTPLEKVDKIFNLAKEDKIVLLQGQLKPNEEIQLIQKAMENITRKFRGIEICTIKETQRENLVLMDKLKKGFFNLMLGNRQGFTIVGPANIVREIKRDPKKIQLFTDVKGNG